MWAILSVDTVVLALVSVFTIGLLRSYGELMARVSDQTREAGAPPPPLAVDLKFPESAPQVLSGHAPTGPRVDIDLAPGGPDTLLGFLSTSCLACQVFWSALQDGDSQGLLPLGTRTIIVTKGQPDESPAAVGRLASSGDVVMSSAAWADFQVPGSPYFAWVDGASGRITGGGTALQWEQLGRLIEAALTRPVGDAVERDRDSELEAVGIRPGDSSLYAGIGDHDVTDLGSRNVG